MTTRITIDSAALRTCAQGIRSQAASLYDAATRVPTYLPEAPPATAGPVAESLAYVQADLRSLVTELEELAAALDARADAADVADARYWTVGQVGASAASVMPSGEVVTLSAASAPVASAPLHAPISTQTIGMAASGSALSALYGSSVVGGTNAGPGYTITAPGGGTVTPHDLMGTSVVGGYASAADIGPAFSGTSVVGGYSSAPSMGTAYGGTSTTLGGVETRVGSGVFMVYNPSLAPPVAGILSNPTDTDTMLANHIVTLQLMNQLGKAQSRLNAAQSALILG